MRKLYIVLVWHSLQEGSLDYDVAKATLKGHKVI